MTKLLIFNSITIIVIIGILLFIKKYVSNNKIKNVILLILPILTILCHYSSIPYHYFLDNSASIYIKHNPNLILPIYPCNVVMWCCLIFGLLKNKESKLSIFLIDYIFWFGIISSLVGLFVNIDFINNPTFKDFDVTKGIIAHALLLLNILVLPIFGMIKIKLERNIKNIFISIIMMYVIGLYCNLIFAYVGSKELAYQVNSMFIIHSPFEGLDYLTYPIIAVVAFILYFIIFALGEEFKYKKEDRWYNRIKLSLKKNKE